MTWKPIDSAPKDGTLLDVWVEYSNGAPAGRWECISWYENAWRSPSLSSSFEPPTHTWGTEVPGKVTHWRYPPKSPQEEAEQLIAGRTLSHWKELARTDHVLNSMVPSDLREILGAIERT